MPRNSRSDRETYPRDFASLGDILMSAIMSGGMGGDEGDDQAAESLRKNLAISKAAEPLIKDALLDRLMQTAHANAADEQIQMLSKRIKQTAEATEEHCADHNRREESLRGQLTEALSKLERLNYAFSEIEQALAAGRSLTAGEVHQCKRNALNTRYQTSVDRGFMPSPPPPPAPNSTDEGTAAGN